MPFGDVANILMPGHPEWEERQRTRASAKRKNNTKTTASAPKAKKRAVIASKRRIPPTPTVIVASTARNEADIPIEATEKTQFFIIRGATFDKIALLEENSSVSTSFSFHDFHSGHSKKAADYTRKKGYNLHLISYKALLSCATRTETMGVLIKGPDEWNKAIELASH